MTLFLVINIVALWAVLGTIGFLLLTRRMPNGEAAGAGEEPGQPRPFHPLIGQQAPPFTGQLLDGSSVHVGRDGKHHLVVVFDPFCKACVDGLPKYSRLQDATDRTQGAFLAVSLGNENDTMEVLRHHAPTLSKVSICPRTSSTFHRDYQISGIPVYFKVDAQGIVIDSGHPDILSIEPRKVTA